MEYSSFPSDRHAKSHCFFKIIISEISSESKLMIPEKFVKKYGTELHGKVRLKAPGGAPWRVDLQRKQGKVWLRNGWPEFATFYSLCFGHSVLFKYQGNCDFEVVIFDTSATEIDYPKKLEKRTKGRANDELRACKKKRVQSGLKENHGVGDCLMQKLQKENFAKASLDNETSSSEEERGDVANGIGCSTRMMKRPIKLEVDLNNPVQQHDYIRGKEECNNACASANAFKSSFPFFIKVMKPSFVGKTQGWFAKKADLKTYMKDRVEVLIIRLGRRTWLVKFRVESNRVKVGLGWQQFAEDNALAVGDVCVFELVEPSKKLLRVTIFKAEPVSGS